MYTPIIFAPVVRRPFASIVRKSKPEALLAVVLVLMTERALVPSKVVRSVETEEPDTSSIPAGLDVPIPTLPAKYEVP